MRAESAQTCTDRRKVSWGETNLAYLIVLLKPTLLSVICYIKLFPVLFQIARKLQNKEKTKTADWFLKLSTWKGWIMKCICTYKMKPHMGDIKK